MGEHELLAERFEAHRSHLRAVAFRLLGAAAEADDAVQEAWLRLSRAGAEGVENLGGWLTTVVARVCLDQLRARRTRREESLASPAGEGGEGTNPAERHGAGRSGPEEQALLSESVSLALLVVLDTLTPAERVAFVLHDLFDLPFDEVAPIVGRTATAARQLASRARRRVRGATPPARIDRERHRGTVAAFLAAARGGDFGALVALLDPDAVVRADGAAVAMGASPEARGAAAVAETFAGRARAAQPALVDGAPGLVWAVGGTPRVVFAFAIARGKIVAIDLFADAERIGRMELVLGAN